MRPFVSPVLDPVEIVRGTLASLSLAADRSVHETHINRISNVLSKTGLPDDKLEYAIDALSILREIEHIGNGYWLPTPTRVISLDSVTSLLVSVAPTIELERHFSNVRKAGLGRLVPTALVNYLPIQSLRSWSGADTLDAASWARALIESSKDTLRPSIAPPDLQAFSVKPPGGPSPMLRNEAAWIPITAPHVMSWNGVSLFRSRLSASKYRYFIGKLTSRHELLEGAPVQNKLRMQYGLAALVRQPLTAAINTQPHSIRLTLPLVAPWPFRRILSALCVMDANRFGYVWFCRQTEYLPIIQSALEELGCEIIHDD